MIRTASTYLSYLLICLLGWALSGCAAIGFKPTPVSGQVLEEGTERPIAGAVVLGLWEGASHGSFIGHSTAGCYHTDTATTDAEGRFSFAPSDQEYRYVGGYHAIIVTAYKKGFKEARNLQPLGETRYYQIEDKGSKKERMDYLRRLVTSSGCGSAAGSGYRDLLLDALFEEAKSLAVDKDDYELVEIIAGLLKRPRLKR